MVIYYGLLFQDVVDEGGEGNKDAGGAEPEGSHVTDTGVLGLYLVGFYIHDIILLKIIIW